MIKQMTMKNIKGKQNFINEKTQNVAIRCKSKSINFQLEGE